MGALSSDDESSRQSIRVSDCVGQWLCYQGEIFCADPGANDGGRVRRASYVGLMPIRSDQKALMFLGAVGVLGAGVRVVRAAGKDSIPAVQPALERQASVADSAASAQRRGSGKKKGRGGRAGRGNAEQEQTRPASPDRPGYVRARLDLDIASAAQIDSLPGVSSTMARRIAVDRARRGPFTNLAGLQRVSGAGKRFLQRIDSLVTFSGTFAFVNPGDTILKSRKKSRK